MSTTSKPATQLEHKTTHATAATGLTSILFAVLYGQTNGVDVTWLPGWAQSIVIVLLPTVVTAWASYRAAHTPRPELAPVPTAAPSSADGQAHSVTTMGEPVSVDVDQLQTEHADAATLS